MKKFSVPKSVRKLVQSIGKNKILFNHPMQRKPDQWSEEQKNLLIHSLLSDYPIPPLYAIKNQGEDNEYSILDGKQRLTVISSYVNDEWSLSDDIPEVVIDDVEYNICGLKFSELNEDVRRDLEDATLLLYILEECTEEEIEEVFYRLNNGTALTKDQKARARLGSELVVFVDEILELEFFKEKASFTKGQLRRAEDQTCVLQTLMLITGHKFTKFGNDDLLKFVEAYSKNYKKEELELCKNLFIKLSRAFKEKNKWLKKINIPMFIIALKTAEDNGISFNKFTEWINNFVNTYEKQVEYTSLCNSNTTNREKVNKRLAIMCNSLIEYTM